MIIDTPVQEAMDQFVLEAPATKEISLSMERCMEMFAEYLLHYSDLYQDDEMFDEEEVQEWEAALGQYVETLFEDAAAEPVIELGSLPTSRLEPEHFRDFLGWFVLREPGINSLEVEAQAELILQWVKFLHDKHWIESESYISFLESIQEIKDEAMRAAQAARLLFHYVRLGGGVSPRHRGKRFDQFVEGHARISILKKGSVSLRFDNKKMEIGPVTLPEDITRYLKIGDVLDIELGSREGNWLIVDIGPVYSSDVYVDADEFEVPEKLS
jgi:hypothetical protein